MTKAPEFPFEQDILAHVTALDRKQKHADVQQLLSVFILRTRMIALTATAFVVLMASFVWSTPPLFSSVSEILIDPRPKRTLDTEIMPTGLGSSALGGDTLLLDSQVEVIKSRSIIKRIIEEEALTADPEFAGAQGWSLLSALTDFMSYVAYGPRGFELASMSPYDRAARKLARRMKVERRRNTYVIEVTVFSENPEKAARIANHIVNLYLEDNSSSAASSTRESAEALQARLDQLRATAEAADEAVASYKRDHGLIGTQNMLVVEQQLRDMNDQLSKARVDAEDSLTRLRQVKAKGKTGEASNSTAIEQLESPVMAQLQVRMAELESRQAELSANLLTRHPAYVELMQRKAALKVSMNVEYKRIVDRLETAYQSAAQMEGAIESKLKALESKTAQSNENTVRLHELENNAAASRNIYETFLRRTKEAWEQVDLPHNTARVISRAYPASRPSYPNVPILLLAAGVLGTAIGFGLAWVMHLLHGTPAWAGSDVPLHLKRTGSSQTQSRARGRLV